MEFELNLYFRQMWEPALRAIALFLISTLALAQSIQLSAEQQLMLDQLPPAQRQQAMDELRQLQKGQTAPTQQSINEAISAVTVSSDEAVDDDAEREAEGLSLIHI